jgi:hypothetical protein
MNIGINNNIAGDSSLALGMTLSVWYKKGKKRRFASGDRNLKFEKGESPLLPPPIKMTSHSERIHHKQISSHKEIPA